MNLDMVLCISLFFYCSFSMAVGIVLVHNIQIFTCVRKLFLIYGCVATLTSTHSIVSGIGKMMVLKTRAKCCRALPHRSQDVSDRYYFFLAFYVMLTCSMAVDLFFIRDHDQHERNKNNHYMIDLMHFQLDYELPGMS